MDWLILITIKKNKHFFDSLPTLPGVYQFFDARGKILYVGKARQLQKRVKSYFQKNTHSQRIAQLVAQIERIEVTATATENEAFILENQWIKKLQPKYNILLRDDKSFLYIVISKHPYPRISSLRANKISQKDREHYHYFGPYPSTQAVRQTIKLMQRIFKIRTCRDSFFAHRSRPCMLYQLHKCTAPCVNYINKENYQVDVDNALALLQGKNVQIITMLQEQMTQASQQKQYELAAKYRDQIANLRQIQMPQIMDKGKNSLDVFALYHSAVLAAVQCLTIREGQLMSSRTYFPQVVALSQASEILNAFIPQYYLNAEIPAEILIDQPLPEKAWLESALSEWREKPVKLVVPTRGDKLKWISMAKQNAELALKARYVEQLRFQEKWRALQIWSGVKKLTRVECFDVSHSGGESAVASCVVFSALGPEKKAYRQFNVEDITPGDDYAALYNALYRRYSVMQQEQKLFPELVLIDGGKGQLTQAKKVFAELNIKHVVLIGIAKGAARKPGFEQFWFTDKAQAHHLPSDDPLLHLIQYIRDEAHRFAITQHRKKRAKTRHQSVLENITGIGAKRRLALLRHFGGLQELQRASCQEIAKAPGISAALAEQIYRALH